MVRRVGCALVFVLASGAAAVAQTVPPASRAFIAVKGGSMHESAEDGLRQTSGALGLSGGLHLSPQWTLDIEVLDNGVSSPEHRETLVSVSAVRGFRESGVRPYLAMGVTVGRNEETRTWCFADRVPFGGGDAVRALVDCAEPDVDMRVPETSASGTSFLLAGGGVMVPLSQRIFVAPEVRVHLAATSVIVRPVVALAVVF